MKQFLKKNRNLLIGLAIIAVFLTLDIVSKMLCNRDLQLNRRIPVIPGVFDFLHIHNEGGAFGLFQDAEAVSIVLKIVSTVASAVLIFCLFYFSKKSKVLSIALALLFAGAVGNLIDRFMQGYVDDFISFAFWPQFAVFNVADIAVTFGLVLFTIYLLFIYIDPKSKKAKAKAQKAESGDTLALDTEAASTELKSKKTKKAKRDESEIASLSKEE